MPTFDLLLDDSLRTIKNLQKDRNLINILLKKLIFFCKKKIVKF